MKKNIEFYFCVLCTALFGIQCTDNLESIGNQSGQETIQVSMEATIPGTKSTLSEDASSISASWELGDKIYIVSSTNGCIGYMSALESGTSVRFEGTLASWSSAQDLHFYYLGKNAAAVNNGDIEFSYDISSQTGTLESLPSMQIMHCVKSSVAAGTTNFGVVTFNNMVSIAKFDLATNLDESATLTCSNAYNKATLNLKTGVFSPSVGDISLGSNLSASVASAYYMVLIPGTAQLSFSDGTTTKTMNKRIASDRFYCANQSKDAIVVNDVSRIALPGEFSVSSSGKKVCFSPGNLYWDGTAFRFENNQYDHPTSWDENHVGHFSWTATASASYNYTYNDPSTKSASDVLFTNATANTANTSFTVDGQTGVWRALSGGSANTDEWNYLLFLRTCTTSGMTNTNVRYAMVKVNGNNGLLLFPDSFTWTAAMGTAPTTVNNYNGSWNSTNHTLAEFCAMEEAGCVFLPTYGYRIEGTSTFYYTDNGGGHYQSSICNSDTKGRNFYFNGANAPTFETGSRANGRFIRLVKDCN